jgi:hypothetical protein
MKRWLVLGLLACACGSSSGSNDAGTSGTGSFTGTVNGHSLTVKDAVFGIDPYSKIVTLIASDLTNVCALLGGTTFPGGTVTVLGTAIFKEDPSGAFADVTADSYAWTAFHTAVNPGPGKWWDGAFALPTDCIGGGEGHYPTGGTITITQMGTTSGTHLKASYSNLTFDAGTADTPLNGSVEAVYCANATIYPNCGRF